MARTVRDTKLDSRKAREGLKAQREPYWRGIDRGAHIGYRKGATGGSWIARVRLQGDRYKFNQIGKADDIQDADGAAILDFSQAQHKAREWFAHTKRLEKGIGCAGYTVGNALDDYLEYLKGRKSLDSAAYNVSALIRPVLGHIDIAELTAKQIGGWHKKMANEKPRLRVKKGHAIRHKEIEKETPDYQRARKNSANRRLTTLKAALNLAFQEGKVASKDAWDRVKPFKNVDHAKIRFLTQNECERLVNACDAEFKKLVQAALLTGCRYAELTRLKASDYNHDSGTLYIQETKSGTPRHVTLETTGQRFFNTVTVGIDGASLIFPKAGEGGKTTAWGHAHQSRRMTEACKKAKISPAVSFHILRHTHASHLASARVPMAVIAAQLGHADTRICEKHYAHLSPNYITDTIRAGFPDLNIVEASNIVAIDGQKKKKA